MRYVAIWAGVLIALFGVAVIVFVTLSAQDSRRDTWMQPERVMDAIGVKAGMVIGEPGAGQGYFTLKLARRVGPTGKVYANDINAEALDIIRDRCRQEGLNNVEIVLGEVADPLFPKGAMELVIFVSAFHDFEKPVEFLHKLKPSLKSGASVVVVDQDPEKTGQQSHFLTRQEVQNLFRQAGYELVRYEDFLSRHFILIFHLSD